MGLAAMPCSDAFNSCEGNASNKTEQSHSHGNDVDDHCSPFCVCSCCSVSVVNIKHNNFFVETEKTMTNTTRKFPIYNSNFVSHYYGNIWQPPKINA